MAKPRVALWFAAAAAASGASDATFGLSQVYRLGIEEAAPPSALASLHFLAEGDFDPESAALLRAERAEMLSGRFYHGTTTVAFRFDGGTMCCVDSRASLGSFVGSFATEKAIPVSGRCLGTMAGSAADCSYWLRLLSAVSKLDEMDTGRGPGAAASADLLSSFLAGQPKDLDLSVGTMLFDADGLCYADSSGTRLAGDLFAVGSGSAYAYSVLDAGYRTDLSVCEAADLAERAVRTAATRDAFSGGFVNVYFADRRSGTWRRLRRAATS